MAITLTYDSNNARVDIEADGLDDETVYKVERGLNDALWTTVRGGSGIEPVGGELELEDYEFVDNVQNYYRVVDDEDTVVFSDSLTPDLGGDVWLKSLRYPALNQTIKVTNYLAVEREDRDGIFEIKGSSLPIAVHDVRGSQEFGLEVKTETLEQARDMDLAVTVGQHMFIHVPDGSTVLGGYVHIGNTQEGARATRGERRYWELPCRVSARPAPSIVGTSLTWEEVFDAYGSVEQLLASNPTWIDLVENVTDPEDFVVL